MRVERIPADVRRVVVTEAKRYYALKRRLKEIDRDILYSSGGAGGSGMPGQPTEQKALRLIQRKEKIERELETIEAAFDSLPRKARAAVKKNICEGVRMDSIMSPLSARQIRRYRREFILKLAELMGEM